MPIVPFSWNPQLMSVYSLAVEWFCKKSYSLVFSYVYMHEKYFAYDLNFNACVSARETELWKRLLVIKKPLIIQKSNANVENKNEHPWMEKYKFFACKISGKNVPVSHKHIPHLNYSLQQHCAYRKYENSYQKSSQRTVERPFRDLYHSRNNRNAKKCVSYISFQHYYYN